MIEKKEEKAIPEKVVSPDTAKDEKKEKYRNPKVIFKYLGVLLRLFSYCN